jgi:hypothetical protein
MFRLALSKVSAFEQFARVRFQTIHGRRELGPRETNRHPSLVSIAGRRLDTTLKPWNASQKRICERAGLAHAAPEVSSLDAGTASGQSRRDLAGMAARLKRAAQGLCRFVILSEAKNLPSI